MLLAVIPGYYLAHSRLKTIKEAISWLLINPICSSGLAFLLSAGDLRSFVPTCLLAQMALWSVYEIGYLGNDYITTRREAAPTLRLSEEDISVLKGYYRSVVGCKYFVAAVCLSLLAYVGQSVHEMHWWRFGLCLVLVSCVFSVHNRIRSRWNLATFFALYCLKTMAVACIYAREYRTMLVAGISLLPLPRLIEYASKKRFYLPNLTRWLVDLDAFRCAYYLVCLIICEILRSLGNSGAAEVLPLFLVMAVFRSGALLVVRLGCARDIRSAGVKTAGLE